MRQGAWGVRAGFEGEAAGFDVGKQRKAAAGVHLGEAACGDGRQFVIVRGIAKVVVGSKIAAYVEADVFRGGDAAPCCRWRSSPPCASMFPACAVPPSVNVRGRAR